MQSRHLIVPVDRQQSALDENPGYEVAFKRYFSVSSVASEDGAVSHIGQDPLPQGTPDMVWLWLVDRHVEKSAHVSVVHDGGLTHIWTADLYCGNGDIEHADGSGPQTDNILESYKALLGRYGATIEADTQRTWFFVRDIDHNYADFVVSRRNFFAAEGLVSHSIASTGIEGNPVAPDAVVSMDAYAVVGLPKSDIRYLEAPDFLNSPHAYGVTFERGVRLGSGLTMISGTASIDKRGEILHVGDVPAQAGRAIDNISALLADAGHGLADVRMALIYVREDGFATDALAAFESRFPAGIPHVVLHAPVCRPGWLVEIECLV